MDFLIWKREREGVQRDGGGEIEGGAGWPVSRQAYLRLG